MHMRPAVSTSVLSESLLRRSCKVTQRKCLKNIELLTAKSFLHRVFTRAGAVRLVARTSRTDGRRRVVRERRVLQKNAAPQELARRENRIRVGFWQRRQADEAVAGRRARRRPPSSRAAAMCCRSQRGHAFARAA